MPDLKSRGRSWADDEEARRTVHLDPEVYLRLKAWAEGKRVTISSAADVAVAEFLEHNGAGSG